MNIIAWVETEYNCQVTQLTTTPIHNSTAVIVDGIAYRDGEKLLVSGMARPHNLSGVKVYDRTDDPFDGL